MATFIAKTVGKRMLKSHVGASNEGTKSRDIEASYPYWEYVYYDKNGNPTSKKRKIPYTPKYLSPPEQKILDKVRKRALFLDEAFTVCGVRVGWGVIYGLIPGLGDVADTILAIWVMMTAMRLHPGKWVMLKMIGFIIIDFVLGLLPIGGDILDGLFRCNTKNYTMLMKVMEARSRANMEKAGISNEIHPTINTQPQSSRLMNEKHAYPNNLSQENRYDARGGRQADNAAYPARPKQAKLGKKSYGDVFVEKYNGWRGGNRDLERGEAAPPEPPRH